MSSALIKVKKSNTYFCIAECRGPLGLRIASGPVKKCGNIAFSNDIEIGENVLETLNLYEDGIIDETLAKRAYEESVISLGFRNAKVFEANSLCVPVWTDGEVVKMMPTKRRGGPNPGFEFVDPEFTSGCDPAEIGRSFRRALALCH